MSLGVRLQKARKLKGLTQQEAADKLGISNGTLSGYERNYRDPDTDVLNRLAELYEVSIDWLLGRTNDIHKVLSDPSRVLIDSLSLNDEDIMKKINFEVDGIPLTEREIKTFIALIRAERSLGMER